jgi:hypothetical protein
VPHLTTLPPSPWSPPPTTPTPHRTGPLLSQLEGILSDKAYLAGGQLCPPSPLRHTATLAVPHNLTWHMHLKLDSLPCVEKLYPMLWPACNSCRWSCQEGLLRHTVFTCVLWRCLHPGPTGACLQMRSSVCMHVHACANVLLHCLQPACPVVDTRPATHLSSPLVLCWRWLTTAWPGPPPTFPCMHLPPRP